MRRSQTQAQVSHIQGEAAPFSSTSSDPRTGVAFPLFTPYGNDVAVQSPLDALASTDLH